MKTNQQNEYQQDTLRYLGEVYVNNPNYSFETIKRMNITELFFKQYERYFKTGTLVVLNFNGHTTDGKSTAAAYLLKKGNEYLQRRVSDKLILGNQQEYAYWVTQNPTEQQIMLQIDEWSKLAETGANATIEQAFFDELSNIHAQTYVHRIYCSPHQLPDPNIILHLEVASKDTLNKRTVCYVYYNLSRGGTTIPQIIGHIVLPVGEILDTQWYQNYRKRKFEKIKLLREHNIYHERELFYAKVIRDLILHFVGLTQLGKYISERNIKSKAHIFCTKEGIRNTILGVEIAILDPVKTVLDMHVDKIKLLNDIERLSTKKTDTNIMKITLLKEQYQKIKEDIEFFMQDLTNKIELFEKYKKI